MKDFVIGADPFVMYDPVSKAYYCYATGNPDETPFIVYKSLDLVSWTEVGHGLSREKNDWGKGWFWAPEVYYNPNNGHYYMFYSALVRDDLIEKYFGCNDFKECCKLGVAISNTPEGPFVSMSEEPIDYYPYDPNYIDIDSVTDDPFKVDAKDIDTSKCKRGVYLPTIDADFFIDDDGRMFLYYSRCCYRNCIFDKTYQKYVEESNIFAVELEPDFWYDKEAKMLPRIKTEFLNTGSNGRRQDRFVQIVSYSGEPQEWENGHVNDYENSNHKKHNRRWSEGSMTIKKNIDGKDKYFVFYSCNNFENALYGVGVAIADKPMGPYHKFKKNPIIHQDPSIPLYSTGHGCVVYKDDQPYYFFHGRENCAQSRICYVARLVINSLDDIHVEDITRCREA